MTKEYGFICESATGTQQGKIFCRDNTVRRFRSVPGVIFAVGDPVTFIPKASRVATEVVRYDESEDSEIGGRVVHRVPDHDDPTCSYGFIIKLDGGGQAWLSGRLPRTEQLEVRTRVWCVCCDGSGNFNDRRFVLKFRTVPYGNNEVSAVSGGDGSLANSRMAEVGAFSKKGTRPGKSKNDDSFLVREIAGGTAWLIAVADGASHPGRGWLAADIVMTIIWDTLWFGERTIDADYTVNDYEGLMREWIDEVHSRFRDRMGELSEPVTSTLTIALVNGTHVHWASCGDCRIYLRRRGNPFKAVIDPKQIATQRDGIHVLTNHIGASDTDWNPEVGSENLDEGDVVFVCSDGMVGGSDSLMKKRVFTSTDWARGSLQQSVEASVAGVAATGEQDDLTLVAFCWK